VTKTEGAPKFGNEWERIPHRKRGVEYACLRSLHRSFQADTLIFDGERNEPKMPIPVLLDDIRFPLDDLLYEKISKQLKNRKKIHKSSK
jgi:hypothetical protein